VCRSGGFPLVVLFHVDSHTRSVDLGFNACASSVFCQDQNLIQFSLPPRSHFAGVDSLLS
jgi:hypothetical protein